MFSFNIKEIDSIELHNLLTQKGDEVKLIDVRTEQEAAQATIPGALNIPLNRLPHHLNDIPEEGQVVFFCRTGARSAQACAYLSAQGQSNVYNLRGGIIAWVTGGLAVA